MTILDVLLGRKRVRVRDNERAVALHKGEVLGIYGAGDHWLPNDGGSLEVERHDLANYTFASPYERALFAKKPEAVAKYLSVFRTGPTEVAIVERDGFITWVLGPDKRLVVWSEAGPWTATSMDVASTLEVEPGLLRRLVRVKATELVSVHSVIEGQAGLLFVDGVYMATLKPGTHGFWAVGRTIQVRTVETRRQVVDITGQELLTKDRVTIRVNLSADYVVTDPLLAVTAVANYAAALYRALQFAFRRTLGALTLDQILEKKVTVDAEAAAEVRSAMAAIGVEVSDIALKDVILPGEMREILNQVVAAEKQAEANIIRRREETNATRSLLNTAKVMAENPVMLRLKELEALEAIAGKVERLTVHNGTGGLLNDLVKLRES
ncbi:MAG: slipin family protein [Rhizobiaceae bacterium]|nr:slipin family protein [Rhizobiaceae bacterium]